MKPGNVVNNTANFCSSLCTVPVSVAGKDMPKFYFSCLSQYNSDRFWERNWERVKMDRKREKVVKMLVSVKSYI